jgi:ABC-type uncharacterized transport system substrate-binding protein
MMSKMKYSLMIGLFVWSFIGFAVQAEELASCKVLVVMTYHEDFFWNQDIKEGIESVLTDKCDLKYVYLDVLKNPDGVEAKVQEAYTLYQEWQPDGVITADDDPQSGFVVPYLKDKVDTPIMFCGVNAEPEKYGFPASNVSGILQRPHVKETITFVRQLVPSIQTVGVISLDIPAGRALSGQIQQEKDIYGVQVLETKYVSKMEEAVTVAEDLKTKCDALLMGPLGNLLDADGNKLTDKDVYPVLTQAFGKATFTIWAQIVPYGVLCAIADRGQEQGEVASEMLLKAMKGTPISELPITRNKKGKRILNVTVMKSLGIKPKPTVLKSVELVESVQ